MKKLLAALNNKNIFYLLLSINFIVSLVVFYLFRGKIGGDYNTYWNLSLGIHHGRYSFWWLLKEYVPDTFRNPGYPLFIYLLTCIYNSIFFVQGIQFILFGFSIILTLKILDKYAGGYALKNLFLLILLPNIQMALSADSIAPDSITGSFIILLIYIDEKAANGWLKYIVMGLVCGIIFQLRAVFLLFPFAKAVVDFFVHRKRFLFVNYATLIVVFILTTIPYGMWNYKNHGVFKITSIEGGAGVMHNSYWSFKLPGYYVEQYWVGNKMAEEIIPFVKEKDIPQNIKAYNHEWYLIDSACAKYETHSDTIIQQEMAEIVKYNDVGYVIHNGKYTMERERLLRYFALKHFEEEPLYTIETRIYTAFRIWITGIQYSELKGKSLTAKIVLIYPFVICSVVFFSFLICIVLAFWRRKITVASTSTLLLPIIYFGLIYLPFAIQARYTIPVRIVLFMLLAISIMKLTEPKTENN